MAITEKRAGDRPFFMGVCHGTEGASHSVSAVALQASTKHAESREPLELLVIADPRGHWYKGGTAA